MKLLFRLEIVSIGYGFVLNQYIVQCLEITFQRRNMLIAEKFIRSLIDKYGKHTVYTDGGTWYPQACTFLHLT